MTEGTYEKESLLGADSFITVHDYHCKEHGSSQTGMILKQ